MIPRICIGCQVEFLADKREVRRGNAKYCTLSCSSKNRPRPIKKPNVFCSHCNIEFYMSESKKRNSKSGLFFCCREHKDISQRLGGIKEIMPPHYGSAGVPSYREKAFELLKNECNVCGYNKHLEVLEVNHIDKNRSNNDISNLEILCPTHHQEFHFLDRSGRWAGSNLVNI